MARTRITPDWQPSDKTWLKCESVRADLNLHEVFAQFMAYWLMQEGEKGKKSNWETTFKNWVVRQPVKAMRQRVEKFDPTSYVNRGSRGGLCN